MNNSIRSILAVLAGLVTIFVTHLGTDQILHMTGVFPPWDQPMNDPALNALALAYRCVFSVLGCYIAARLAPSAPMAHALTLGAIGTVLSTIAVELWTAIAFAIAGAAQTIHAFAARSWGGFFWGLLVGLLYLAAGVVLWLNPIAGVVTLTVFLAAVLVVDGVFRSILAFQVRGQAGSGCSWAESSASFLV